MRVRHMIRWAKVSLLVFKDDASSADIVLDACEYLRAKTVDLPKKFLDRGRI